MDNSPYRSKPEFLEQYQALAWKIARAFTQNRADREDLVQEINISLWSVYEKIPKRANEFTYVYRVALNRAISWQRKERTYLQYLKSFFAHSQRIGPNPEQPSNSEDLEILYAAIRQLPELERTLVLLSLEKRSYVEMADIMGLNETTVGKRLSRARKTLSKMINKESIES